MERLEDIITNVAIAVAIVALGLTLALCIVRLSFAATKYLFG